MKKAEKNRGFGDVLLRYLYLPVTFVISEMVLRLCVYRSFEGGTLTAVLFAAAAGFGATILTLAFPEFLNRLLNYLVMTVTAVYFATQLVYYTVFQRFMSLQVATGVGTDVLEFKDQIFDTIAKRWYGILLLFAPLLLRILLDVSKKGFAKKRRYSLLYAAAGTALCYLLFLGTLLPGKEKTYSASSLYFEEWEDSIGIKKLGMFVGAWKDIKQAIGGKKSDGLDVLSGDLLKPSDVLKPVTTPTPIPTKEPQKDEKGEIIITPSPEPTQPPKYHEQYDFAAMAQNEKKESIKTLDNYFASLSPDEENEYTGLFKGYNYIMITAEGFSPWAIDKDLTPTLYKMMNNGIVFNNFYCPLWHTSTSDGEYIACTGLVPDGAHSMRRTSSNDMKLAFGNQFASIGYKTMAFHNNSYTYYDRNKTHPNLGYQYMAIGNGLKLPTSCWPRSDYEMMVASLPEYINSEPFHAYYMTVSGHMQYTFNDNMMAYQNRQVVADLPYSSEARAYIACNYELEKAMTYLLEELEKAGVADHTVIVLYPDHYPYGLDKQYIDEIAGHEVEERFELYKSCLMMYCAGIEKPIVVDKVCSSLDIAPTVSNLFGLSYDSRLFAGSDVFSKKEGLVIFDDKRFITDRVMYDVANDKATLLQDMPVSREYLENKLLEVKQKFAVSKGILDGDYYSYLPD